ncbi:MAG: glycosyl hydrolase family 18 protein [Lachnospiraceae bacterium]
MQIYVVQSGDNIDAIAGKFDVPVNRIIYDNQLVYPYQLAVGQALVITDGIPRNKRGVLANGFAYPFISNWVLEQTLPYLSELSVFSYGFTEEGSILPPVIDPAWMVNLAHQYETKPILTLPPFGLDGKFSNALIHAVLNNTAARENLIDQLQRTVEEEGYQGVNIDFEFILAEDRDLFTEFVRDVTVRMNEIGYEVTVDLAPKTSDTQKGLLYEGKDYGALGAVANKVFVMTYEWGYTYGPAMAVAPIDKVRVVVEYALSKITANKINLGIPNYGYDWTLPYISGESKAQTIGNIEAVRIAIANGATIEFDETAMAPYFYYSRNGEAHEVWFEDARSIQAKYDLYQEYGLQGVGYWQIMQFFRAAWIVQENVI